MASTRYLTYYIVLTDPKLVAQYQAQFPFGYQFAPFNPNDSVTHLPGGAAVAFAAPWAGSFPGTDPNHVASGTYFGPAPFTWSPEWTSANNYDCTVASFQRRSGGFWGIGGTTVTYYWLGQFVLNEPPVPTINGVPPVAPQAPAKVRLIDGFEFGSAGSSGLSLSTGSGWSYSRDAARHVGGIGLAFRGPSGATSLVAMSPFAAVGFRTWERFYIRLRKSDPGNTVVFWGTRGDADNSGFDLGITADGRLAVFTRSGATNRTFISASNPLAAWTGLSTDDAWHKIDVLLRYNPASAFVTTSQIRVFIDGVETLTVTTSSIASQHHSSTQWGTEQTGTLLYLDVDDWRVSDWPALPNEDAAGLPPNLTGPDWLSGTKIVRARAKQFGAAHSVNWAGGVQTLLQNPMDHASQEVGITSTTASAIAEIDLDLDQCVTKDAGKLAVYSYIIAAIAKCTTNGTAGYTLNGGAAVNTAFSEGATFISLINSIASTVVKSLTDGVAAAPTALTSLSIRHTKSADANQGTLALLGAQIELSGMWGKPDYRVTENGTSGTPTPPRVVGQHNAPYPYSVFAKSDAAPPPNSPVIVTAGTYVGNGTGQDITFRAPVHFLFIRPLSGDAGGMKWWSSMIASHKSTQQSVSPFIQFDEDTTFVPGLAIDVQQQRYRMRLAGGDTQVNAVGITYQYVAFSDPGARFLLCGQMSNKTTLASNVYALIDAGFTPEAALLHVETFDQTSTAGMLFKGVGTAADAVMRFAATAQVTAALTFGAGQFTSQANLHALTGIAMPFALWRRHDGNNDPGEPGVVALLNWVGDGSASRTINIAPASGKRPIFAMVCASDAGGGAFRDPSHTTTNSVKDSGNNSATCITGGGIDSLSVGVTLNANGVTYSALVLFGDATAGNGGFGVNGEFIPVETAPPADGPFQPAPTLDQLHPVVPATPVVGEPDLDQITTLSDVATNVGGLAGGQKCEYYSRHVVNMALSRIGVSKRITDLANDLTEEAVLARSHVLEDTNQVLRDFDWPFATRYATLVLVAGTSTVRVNQDWQYAYRVPSACMKARRLVNQTLVGRDYDRNPPKFRIGGDDTGTSLLYTNEPTSTASPLVLEYTVRSICPALYGDALFRDALAWKFAFSLAAPLSKDSKKQDYCRAMYERAIALAKVPAAQESQQAKPGEADWINDREFGGNTNDPWDR